MAPATWHSHNTTQQPPTDVSSPFKLSIPSGTDLWRSSETHDAASAPAFYTRVKSSEFSHLSTTVSQPWKGVQLYDQAGLLMYWPGKEGSPAGGEKARWIKAGIEIIDGQTRFSVVTCDRYSDWSLHAVMDFDSNGQTQDGKDIKIEARRDGDALWIIANGVKVREPKFAFLEDRRGDAELWVGVTAARPGAGGPLEVGFEGVELSLL